MASITIKPQNFILGESQTDDISDKGFSPDSFNLNLTKERGKLYFREDVTDRGGAILTGNIVASCEDPALTGNHGYFIDDEAAFYRFDGTTLSKEITGGNTYQLGTTDLIPFNDGNFYATSQDAVAQFDNDIGTLVENWWSGLNSNYRHPLEVVEKELFIADKNVIYYWDGTTSGTAFTLPSGQNITTLRKHPDGKTLLAFTGSTADFSHTLNGKGKVYYCQPSLRGAAIDGWTREVELEAQVEGSRLVGGTVFASWGKSVGVFDGNGLIKLKELETSTTTYSQNMSNMEDIFLIRDGLFVRAYGDLGAGARVWWKPFKNTTNSNDINNIFYKGDNVLMVAFQGASAGTGLLKEVDYDNSGLYGTFYSNRYYFDTEVVIKKIEIFHDVSNPAGATAFALLYRDPDDTENQIVDDVVSYTNQSVSKTITETDIKTDIFQLKINGSTDDIGYKMIRIYYDAV